MTIYTSKVGDKKENNDIPPPEVVTDAILEKKQNEANLASGGEVPPTVVAVSSRTRRSGCANLCVLLTALVVVSTGIFGGIYLYKHLAHRTFRGWCGVKYYEYREAQRLANQAHYQAGRDQALRRYYGQFEEKVEIDKVNGQYEKIEVPDLDETRRATVLHDFERNLTAIVDKVNYHCFILPLNRSRVTPPKDFWDLLNKLSNGYYLPDAELVKERYQVVYPRIYNLGPYGYHIWRECHRFDTYHLERVYMSEEEPRQKRSADEEPEEREPSRHFTPEESEARKEMHQRKMADRKHEPSNRLDKDATAYNMGVTGTKWDVQVFIFGLDKLDKKKE